jgi:nucleotide-binding universal stress UspA family protein
MWLLTFESILVATDLTEGSGAALRTAERLARLAGASLHLLHVASSAAADDVARLREEYDRAVADGAEPDTVETIVGAPAAVIVEQAVRVGADAVVLGPHRRPDRGGEMGSTAASVVRTAPCPCLVVATELRLPLERVLVPVDLSGAAGGALSVALSWASALRPRAGRAELLALHVTPHPASPIVDEAVRDEVRRARARAGGAARVEIREEVVEGADPAEEILREGTSASADLLVMGTHGAARAKSGLGSVSAAVARAAPCPHLLVPPAAWEARDDYQSPQFPEA